MPRENPALSDAHAHSKNVPEEGDSVVRNVAVQRMLAEGESNGLGVGTIMAILGGTMAFLGVAVCVSSCVH